MTEVAATMVGITPLIEGVEAVAADEVEVHPSTEMEAMLWVPVLERLMPGMNLSHRGKKGSAGER